MITKKLYFIHKKITVIMLAFGMIFFVSAFAMNEPPPEAESATQPDLFQQFLLNPAKFLADPAVQGLVGRFAPEGSYQHQAIDVVTMLGGYGVTPENAIKLWNMIPSVDGAKSSATSIIPSFDFVVEKGVDVGEKIMDVTEKIYNLPEDIDFFMRGKGYSDYQKSKNFSQSFKNKALFRIPLINFYIENYKTKNGKKKKRETVQFFTAGDDSENNQGSLSAVFLGKDFLRIIFHLARFGVDKVFFDKLHKAFIKNAIANVKAKKNNLLKVLDDIPRDVDGALIWDTELKKNFIAQCVDILSPSKKQRTRMIALATIYLLFSESIKYIDHSFVSRPDPRDFTGLPYYIDVERRRETEQQIKTIQWNGDKGRDKYGNKWIKNSLGDIVPKPDPNDPFAFANNQPDRYVLTDAEKAGIAIPLIPQIIYAHTEKRCAISLAIFTGLIEASAGLFFGRDPLLFMSQLPWYRWAALSLIGWNNSFLDSDSFYFIKRIAMLSHLFNKTTTWIKNNSKAMLESRFDEFCDHVLMLNFSNTLSQEEAVEIENSFKSFIIDAHQGSSREWILFKNKTLSHTEFFIEMALMLPVWITIAKKIPFLVRNARECFSMAKDSLF